METFSALLAFCAVNSPVTGEFPSQRPVTRSFDVFFHLCLNKRLSKQLRGWWFKTPSRSLGRHCNATPRMLFCLFFFKCSFRLKTKNPTFTDYIGLGRGIHRWQRLNKHVLNPLRTGEPLLLYILKTIQHLQGYLYQTGHRGPLLLTSFNFNLSMDI